MRLLPYYAETGRSCPLNRLTLGITLLSLESLRQIHTKSISIHSSKMASILCVFYGGQVKKCETQFGPVHGAMLQWPSKEPMKWL